MKIRIPSVKTLETRLRVNPLEAKRLRNILKQANEGQYVSQILSEISDFLGFSGTETICAEVHGNYPAFAYANSGETYAQTILFDPLKSRFLVCSWGDFVESNPSFNWL